MAPSCNSKLDFDRPPQAVAKSRSLPFAIVLALPIVVALALRVPFIQSSPDTPDAVRLIRSTQRFDPLDFAPQFPGYPLAVLLTKLLPFDAGTCWSLLAAVSGAVACGLLAGILATAYGNAAALAGGLVVASIPSLAVESLRIGTDIAVLPWLLVAFILAERGRMALAGFVLGLGFGIRPSAFVWLVGLFARPGRVRALAGLLLGIAIWLVPTLVVVGSDAYIHEGWRFTKAHFIDWGGTMLSTAPASESRLARIATGWLLPLGAWLSLVAVGALVLYRKRRALPTVALGTAATMAWISVAQNPDHFRHFLPIAWILTAFGVTAIVGFANARLRPRQRIFAGILIATLTLGAVIATCNRAARYRESTPPVLSAIHELEAREDFDPLLDRVYVGSEYAYFTWQHPEWSSHSAATLEAVAADLDTLPVLPRRVWLSHSIRGVTMSPSIATLAARDLYPFQPEYAMSCHTVDEFGVGAGLARGER